MFRDYRSTVDDFRKEIKKLKNGRALAKSRGVDIDSFESIYAAELKHSMNYKDPFSKMRFRSELEWYRSRRPFFNVYPVIEKKLLAINDEIKLEELFLPFKAIEIRTTTTTFLLSADDYVFFFTVEIASGGYQEFCMSKRGIVGQIEDAPYQQIDTDFPNADKKSFRSISTDDRRKCAMIACGVCLLAKDPSIVVPVVLNKHRKENMTADELRQYAAKATEVTGKTGFDVGRDMQMKQMSCHYRNGCFAKYYVSKKHPSYPDECMLEKAPIIKWRSGAVVNANNPPKVPTGFKGNESEFN